VTLSDLMHGLPEPPPCEWTQDKFVRVSIECKRNDELVHWLPPTQHDGNVYEWDDACNDYVFVREMTAEEKEKADAAYEKASAEWKRTQGAAYVAGPTTTRGTFYTASGDVAEAMLDRNDAWHWVSFRSESKR